MKKIILLLVIIFVLCGCSKSVSVTPQEVAEKYKQNFSSSVIAVFGDNRAEMEASKNGMSISVSVNFPAELSGMGIEIFDEHAKIIYEGMEQEIKKDSLPEGTPFLLLEELFDELSDPDEFTLSTENENIIAKGEGFSAVLSPEDFSLVSAKFPLFETEFTFSDFVFKSAE
ncbi:MAG: membrane lipoprotein lipid attachment site-containing protein [Oscillospiraceae bacterium]|nr:membrane lipoprotein lipid attachment site-containing protein [Oscillospiraceae bacterium]